MPKNVPRVKPIIVLLLGCLPLAVLTVASFAGIGSLNSELPALNLPRVAPPTASVAVPSGADMDSDETLRSAVTEREFLAGEPLPEPARQAEPVYWESLVPDWKQWCDATELVRRVLAIEESLTDRSIPALKASVQSIGAIQEECRKRDPAGVDRLLQFLERRSRDLQLEIAGLERKKRAAEIFAEAKDAFEAREYRDCIDLCRKLQQDYSEAIDYRQVSALRGQALFRQEWAKLPVESPVTDEPFKQRESLINFLDVHKEAAGDFERKQIAQVEEKLAAVNEEIRRIELNREAKEPLASLTRYDDRSFGEGLEAAVRVAEQYPTGWVESQLQRRVAAWLARVLPPKELDEPANIEEVETKSGTVLRGFFQPVSSPGGEVIGYKRYPTAEEREQPTRNVGRYPAADLRGVPTSSVPRQCVEAYEAARTRLLEDPGNRDRWEAMQRVCETAETTLIDYRRKPGSSREPLSFDRELRFAKAALAAEVWPRIKKVWPE